MMEVVGELEEEVGRRIECLDPCICPLVDRASKPVANHTKQM